MAGLEEPRSPRPQACLPAAGDEPGPGAGPGKLRPEPRRGAAGPGSGPAPVPPGRGRAERAAPPRPPASSAGRASPAGGPGALCARGGGGGWVAARAPLALAFAPPVPSSSPSSFYFWPPPPPVPPALLPSSAFHLPARLPGRAGAAAAAAAARGGGGDAGGGGGGGGGQEAAPLSGPPGGSHRGGGGRRRLVLCPALHRLLLPARPGPRLPLGPAARRAGSPGFAGAGGGSSGPGPGGGGRASRPPRGAGFVLAAASPLFFGSDMEDGSSNNASCFRRLTECFLSPSKCRAPHCPRRGRAGCECPGRGAPRRASLATREAGAHGWHAGASISSGTPGFPRLRVHAGGGRRAVQDLLFPATLARHVLIPSTRGPLGRQARVNALPPAWQSRPLGPLAG